MFDLTPHITLTAHQRIIYTVLRALLFVGFFGVSTVVLLRILFPSAYYHFDMARPNALDNTINAPALTTDGATAFSANTIGTYTRAIITLTLTDNAAQNAAYTLTVHRGYDALFTTPVVPQALAATITNHTPALGELFIYRNGIFTVDYVHDTDTDNWHPALRAIDDVRTFDAKGWSFDVVRDDITSDNVADLPTARMFTPRTMHPIGTVFRNTVDGALYRLTQTTDHIPALVRVSSDTLTPTTPVITTHFTDMTAQEATCTLTPHILLFQTRSLTCHIALDTLTAPGSDFRFVVDGITPDMLTHVAVRMDAAHTASTLRASLGLIKQRLLQQYQQ